MPFILLGVGFELLRGFLCHFVRQHTQWLPGLQRLDVSTCCALEVVEAIKGLRHRCTDDQDTVVTHDHDLLFGVGQECRTPIAFILQGQTTVMLVNDVAVKEHGGVLIDRPQATVGE